MLTGIDHIVLIVPDLMSGASVYASLLGRSPDWQATGEGGEGTALFRVDNTALELMGPVGEGPVTDRLREIITENGPGLTSLVFGCEDIGFAHHKLTRRGLKPQDVQPGSSMHDLSGDVRNWRRFRCGDGEMAGIKTFILEHDEGALPVQPADTGAVHSLDHIVINTPNPDRAASLYGARLGLDLALDRTAEQWDTRFLFFRTGGLTLEIINRLSAKDDASGPDTFYGLTWAVQDIEAAHERLDAAGFALSDIRKGRKPGSTVFTVRDGTMNVPTLFISHSSR